MTFDGVNKRIILSSTSITASEVWSAYMDWLNDDNNNARWGLVMTQIGGDDLGGGLFVPIYIFLQNGWRLRPMEANHQLMLNGNMFVAEGGSPLVNTLGNFNVIAQFTVPVQAQAMATSGSSGVTAQDVWEYGVRELTSSTTSSLTAEQNAKLMASASKADVFNASML